MKKITVLVLSLFLGACASLGVKPSCSKQDLQTVSYFEEGQKLLAFRFSAQARGYRLNGVLQVKKAEGENFEVIAFAATGAYRLMTAQVSQKGAEFTYVLPLADYAIVRGKVETFLKALLFPPQGAKSCREENGIWTVYADGGNYQYRAGQEYPYLLTYKKTLGSVALSYSQYTPYEQGQLPHYLKYQDGEIEAEMVLISLR
ncbi:MAG: hypothetical protein IKL48_04320 [Elusimicrobiaceae bacterium]|nr:hypothetical protein [Elusimicrobiaceae bacterium]